jgi:hypothetical protein
MEEQGVLKFAVEQTLYGESVAELRTRYAYTRSNQAPVADWGGHVWDDHPPRRGQRLALLVYGKESRERYAESVKQEGLAFCVWDAPEGDPFIAELRDGCSFLTATDVNDRINLVKRLGGSKYRTIRGLVQSGVFGVDERGVPQPPDASPQLVSEYLRASDRAITDDYERGEATRSVAVWLSDKGHAQSVTEDLRKTFEGWYLGELNALGSDRNRDIATLNSLTGLCQKLGVVRAINLFSHMDRGNLTQRVAAYLDSPNPQAKKEAEKLLDILSVK